MKTYNKEALLVTNFIEPGKMIESEYGTLRNMDWLEREKGRIKNTELCKNNQGFVALKRKVTK